MEWFRWYHGTAYDPKFRLVAQLAETSIPEVLAVWQAMLEHASQASPRGSLVGWSDKVVAVGLGMDTNAVERIRTQANACELTRTDANETSYLTAWDKRQPKREDGSAERAKSWRDKKKFDANASERIRTQTNTEQNRTEQRKEEDISSSEKTEDRIPFQKIVDLYHEILPELTKVRVLTAKREGYIRSRWNEDAKRRDLRWWRQFFQHVRKQPHLMGQNDRGWRADLEWLTAPTGFAKAYEGKFLPRDGPAEEGIPTVSLSDAQVEAMCKPKITPAPRDDQTRARAV